MHHFNHFYGTYLATATVLLAKIVKSSLVYCSSLFLSHPSSESGRLDVSKENKQQLMTEVRGRGGGWTSGLQ